MYDLNRYHWRLYFVKAERYFEPDDFLDFELPNRDSLELHDRHWLDKQYVPFRSQDEALHIFEHYANSLKRIGLEVSQMKLLKLEYFHHEGWEIMESRALNLS